MPATAAAVRRCGMVATTWDCGDCGLKNAHAVILTNCDSRACPQCSKLAAKERVERLTPAFARVPSYNLARKELAIAKLSERVSSAKQAADYWAKLEKWDRSDRAEERRKHLKWQLERVKDPRWGYKLLTISPQWKPWDDNELTIEGIKRRIADAFARWERVWQKLECGGQSAAIVSVELSEGGHIHIHAAVYAPYVVDSHIAELAGCFVDIRECAASSQEIRKLGPEAALYKAIRETVKYTCKAPSPKWDFVGGARRKVVHPELVVRWTIATKSLQLGRLYGLARDAMAAEKAAQTDELAPKDNESKACCPVCKSPLVGMPRIVRTVDLQRELTEWEWSHRVRWRAATGVLLSREEIAARERAAQQREFNGTPGRCAVGERSFTSVFNPIRVER